MGRLVNGRRGTLPVPQIGAIPVPAEAGLGRSLASRAQPGRWLGRLVNASAMGSSTVVLFLMCLVVADVTGRYVFNNPVPMTYEIGSFMLVFIVFLGMAYTQRMGSHIRVEFLTLRLSKKARAVLDLLSYTLGILVYAAIFYQGFRWAYEGFRVGDYTPGLVAIPRWPSMFVVPFGALLLCLQFSGDWVRRFRELRAL
jgi:TRAP-type C4-dicarboxylate transport system permease small subunit